MKFIWIVQFLVIQTIFFGIVIFVLKRVLVNDTEGAVNRLNKDTDAVRAKQAELNEKIKQANEELAKRKAEAEALVKKMTDEAEEKAKEEREKIINKARQEGEEVITKAQKTKEDLRKNIEKEVEIKMVDFAALVLFDVMSQKAKEVLNETLIEEFLENVEKIDMSMISEDIRLAGVVTAQPLSGAMRARLSKSLQDKLKREVAIEAAIDASILGGAILQFGSLKLDGSLQNFIRESASELKDRIDRGTAKDGKSQ